MKLIIAGTAELLVDAELIDQLIKHYRLTVTEVVCGVGGRVDEAGEDYSDLWMEKEPKIFRANWSHEGAKAGTNRNIKMAEYSDALLLIWDGVSKDALNIKKEMDKLVKPVYEVILRVYE